MAPNKILSHSTVQTRRYLCNGQENNIDHSNFRWRTPFILLQKLMVDHILKTLIPIAFALKLTAFGILMEILKIFRRSPADSDCIFFLVAQSVPLQIYLI
jgi:hypothetical protein